MAIFAADPFDRGPDNTLLRTAAGPVVWAKHPNFAGEPIYRSNRLSEATGTALMYAADDPATAEYDVQLTAFNTSVANGQVGAAGRIDLAANTHYRAVKNGATLNLQKLVAGTTTTLATLSGQPNAINTGYDVTLELRDAAKKMYVGGVEKLSTTDNTITAKGKPGFYATQNNSDPNGTHFDNWSATNPTTPDTTLPIPSLVSETRTKVGPVAGKDSTDVTWNVDEAIQAWEFRVVPADTSPRASGAVIVSGGAQPASTNVTTTLTEAAIVAAGAAEGTNVVKLFTQDIAGNWSS